MRRYLTDSIQEICFKYGKFAMLSGPRQSGKTTFAQNLLGERGIGAYYNWDQDDFRLKWIRSPQSLIEPYLGHTSTPLIVLDEIHKDRVWKRRVKGIYDSKRSPLDLLITGSSRLNVFRRGSDSLVGRAFHFHLHPLSVGEVLGAEPLSPERFREILEQDSIPNNQSAAQEAMESFLQFGTFPEPYLKQDSQFLRVWRRNRMDQILTEDVRDLSQVQDIAKLSLLYELLAERVGSFVGKSSLREVLECSFDTISRWIEILNSLFITFEVPPYNAKLPRAIRRERKLYLWEISNINEDGAKFENLIALHLLKACHLWSDIGEAKFELHFIRTKEGDEIDFLITRNKKPWIAFEVKLTDTSPSKSWRKLMPLLNCKLGVQLVAEEGVHRDFNENGRKVVVMSASRVLAGLGV